MVKTKLEDEKVVTDDTVKEIETEETPKVKAKKVVTLVEVHFKNGTTRTFSPDIHGEDFVSIADEFCATNVNTIQSREDK